MKLYNDFKRNYRNILIIIIFTDNADVKRWLDHVGYDMNSFLPSPHPLISPILPPTLSHIHPSTPSLMRSSLYCAFKSHTSQHHNDFLFMPPSKLQPQSLFPRNFHISIVPPIFGRKILVSAVESDGFSGVVGITTLQHANARISLIASTFLNESLLILPHYNSKSKDVHHFVRQDSTGEEYINEFALRPEGVIQGLDVNVRQNLHDNKKAEIKIHGNHTIVYIRFGVSVDEERERIARHAKLKILENAWALEKQLVSENKLSISKWTDEQRKELILNGKVNGVKARYVRDVNVFSELLDDPRNVEFVGVEELNEGDT